MYTIEIDFDVHKALMNLRVSEEMSYNDVLRKLLGLGIIEKSKEKEIFSNRSSLIIKGVEFVHGTKFRVIYKEVTYNAEIDDGYLIFNGKRFTSPSMAGIAITGYNVNGWTFWECFIPGKNMWIKIDKLRKY